MQLSFFDQFWNRFILGNKGDSRAKTPRTSPRRRKRSEQSDPVLQEIWNQLRETWFPQASELDAFTVVWSKRSQKRTLASCNVKRRKVVVARELRYPQHRVWLDPLLYHEMCHAYLGNAAEEGEKAVWHGREFKSLERRHPEMRSFNQWLKSGGWETAVRSDRAKRAFAKRKELDSLTRAA